jgi:hypothetical protein
VTVVRVTRNVANSGIIDPTESLPSQYVVDTALTWISWDAPTIAYPGIDIDYTMLGYDYFNRVLTWSIDSGPGWLSIGSSSGKFTGVPTTDNVNEPVTVRLTPQGGTPVTTSFTIQVDADKCKFVSTTGNDSTGTGAIGAPYLTISKALDVCASGSANTGWLIIIRGGEYTDSWTNNTTWTDSGTAANPLIIRPYPGETFTINNDVKGWGMPAEWVIYHGPFEVLGGSESENSCLGVNRNQVAKLITGGGYRLSNPDNNPTGFKTRSNARLYRCYSSNNYSAANQGSQNNSNFLHFCDGGDEDEAFYIECGGLGESVANWKLKHSGTGRVHVHRCAMRDSPNGTDMRSDWSSVRHSLIHVSKVFANGNGSAVNWGNSSGTNASLGILYDGNLIICEDGTCGIEWGWDGSQDATNCPVGRANTIVMLGEPGASNFAVLRQSYGASVPSPPVRRLIDNIIYSPDSAQVQLNATTSNDVLTIAEMNAEPCCSGNVHMGAIGSTELTYQAAGYNWSFTAAGGLVQGSAL